MSDKFVAFTLEIPELTSVLSAAKIDQMFDFHESTFTDFPEENGVRSFIDPTTDFNIYVANVDDLSGLINAVKVQIVVTEAGLDDLSEDDDEFTTLNAELDALRTILSTLEQLAK